MNWSQKAALPGSCSSRTGTHPRAAAFPREPQTTQLEDFSSGALTIPGLSDQGEQGLIAAGTGGTGGALGALAAFPFSKARDPIPGTAQTLLAVLTWEHQGAELCLCVLQSQLSGD